MNDRKKTIEDRPYFRNGLRSAAARASRKCKCCKKSVENNNHFYRCPTIDTEWMTDVPEQLRFDIGRNVLECFREVIKCSPPLCNESITSWDLTRAFKSTLEEATHLKQEPRSFEGTTMTDHARHSRTEPTPKNPREDGDIPPPKGFVCQQIHRQRPPLIAHNNANC